MFADSMLETTWAQRSRRGWSTLTSFGAEAVILGVLLLLPLWKTVGLPTARVVSTPISAGRIDPGPAPTSRTRAGRPAVTPASTTVPRFVAPGQIPDHVFNGPVDPAPDVPVSCVNCAESIGDVGASSGLPNALFAGNHPVPVAPAPKPVVHTFRPSSLLEGSLVRRVVPVYPPLARAARIEGPVVLFAQISKVGTIENLRTVSGHPLLVRAAVDAVSQWRYRPYILNSEPVEVETQITVVFSLN